MQTSVSRRPGKYIKGKCYSDRERVASFMPLEDIGHGLAVVRSQVTGQENCARLPNMNSLVVTLSADMVSGDVVTAVVDVVSPDGTTSTVTINKTYATSHVASVTAIKASFEAVANVTLTLSGSNRILTIVAAADKRLVVTTAFAIVNGGGGTATISSVKGTTDSVILGVAEYDPNDASVFDFTYTEPVHKANRKMMSVVKEGDPAMPVAGTPVPGAAPYILLEDYTDTGSVLNVRGSARHNTDSSAAPVLLATNMEFSQVKDSSLAPVSILKA